MNTTLTEMKAKGLNETQGDVEAEALVETLANTLLEVVAKRNTIH